MSACTPTGGAPTTGSPTSRASLYALSVRWEFDVFGWGFMYGRDPAGKLAVAALEVERLDLVGWAWDDEEELLRRKNAADIVAGHCRGMKAAYPAIVQGFCSMAICWQPGKPANPYWNPVVWEAAAEYCEEGLPMAYWPWNEVSQACAFVDTSISQWRQGKSWKVIPLLRTWNALYGKIQPSWILPLIAQVTSAGAFGACWFTLDKLNGWPALYRGVAEAYSDLEG